MTTHDEAKIDDMLAPTAVEYVGEEKAREGTGAAVFSVHLSPATHDAVRAAAARAHLTLRADPSVGD